jgi:hypothetical protein
MTLLLTHSLGAAAERKELEKRHSSVAIPLSLSPHHLLYICSPSPAANILLYIDAMASRVAL